MSEEGGGEEYRFLGDPQWESLPGGRVRCVQTGHEMPLAAQATYTFTKKCRSALFEAALAKRTSPLNFFDQSPVAKDKIICKLTGVVLNKKEEAVWKHMLGKKFEQKLVQIEAEKEGTREDVEMTESSKEKPSVKKSLEAGTSIGYEDKARRQRNDKASAILREVEDQEAHGGTSSEESDFWVPPAGDRWDFDTGHVNRWSAPSNGEPCPRKSSKIDARTQAAVENGLECDDTDMVDGDAPVDNSCSSDEDDEVKVRTKRTQSASTSVSLKKRRAKRLKPDLKKPNGVWNVLTF